MDARDVTERTELDGSDLSVVDTVGELSVVTSPGSPDRALSSDDGGDVARDPDEIAQEIEQTRAELADTIDAIADRISPRKAAARGVQAVKSGPSRHAGNDAPPVVPLAALAGLVVLVLVFVRKRRRR
jgi:hypothetical protein